jgi:hypothetical protein
MSLYEVIHRIKTVALIIILCVELLDALGITSPLPYRR